jgi:hypothetical protein
LKMSHVVSPEMKILIVKKIQPVGLNAD